MSIELEVYEQIRRYKEEGLGKKTVAKLLGVSRNTVKKYWDGSTVPWVYLYYKQNEKAPHAADATASTVKVLSLYERRAQRASISVFKYCTASSTLTVVVCTL